MRKILFATFLIILSIGIFSACSKDDNPSTPKAVHIYVLFTPESFCNMGYNDITLKAIETLSHKYGYEYSFCVPESIEEGMSYYTDWCLTEVDDDVSRSLFVFASNLYDEPLANAPHPTDDPRKDILMFEVARELPYAYTFAMTYYGASYMIGSFYLRHTPADFHIIAANPYLKGLDEVVDGFSAAAEETKTGTVSVEYISESADGGLDDDDKAFYLCKVADLTGDDDAQIFIPFAGLSNLGVYRFSQSNHQLAVGVDCIDPNSFSHIKLCMNKRMDLALDDFLELWMNGDNAPRHRFYTLESGKVVVDKASIFNSYTEELDSLYNRAVAVEREYFQKRGVDEAYL